jgi:cytochrome c biogenesis protein CcdA
MDPVTLGFSAAWIMGLLFGAGPCNVACLPYFGPVLLREGSSWRTVIPFSAGRLLGYTLLGGAAGGMGHVILQFAESRWAAVVLGTATIITGLLLLKRHKSVCGASNATKTVQFVRHRAVGGALFMMGMGLALNPCVPLGTVLLAAAASADPWMGAWIGLGFGTGAILIPALVLGFALSRLGAEARAQLAPWGSRLEKGAGMLLIMLGTFTVMGWVTP